MKKALLILSFLGFLAGGQSQIVFENTYPGSTSLTKLALSGDKYYLMDAVNNQCRIYSATHALWKTIPLAIPANMFLYDVKLVSETLFNSDAKVELAYIYYAYDTTYYYYTYYMKVVNETGTELLSVPGCGYLELKSTSEGASKMLCYVYNYSVYPSTVNTMVYALPGTMPVGESEILPDKPEGKPWPNPANSIINIPFSLPGTSSGASLKIFNQNGIMIKHLPLNQPSGVVSVPLETLPRGIYLYQFTEGLVIHDSGRFIRN
jgi:hypothetical protein